MGLTAPGLATYAIRAVRASRPTREQHTAGRAERDWQRDQLAPCLCDLVVEEQVRRNRICWLAFDD